MLELDNLDELYKYGMLLLESIDTDEQKFCRENARLTEELTQEKQRRAGLIDTLSGLLASEQGE